jgi:hypothetical protein
MILRAFLVWVVIAAAEALQGSLRVRFLNRRAGDRRARQIGVFCGSGLLLTIAWFGVPWIGADTELRLLGIGLLWLALMLAFHLAFERLVLQASWDRIMSDFDLRRGGLLGIGMLILFAAPLLVAKLRGLM